MSRVADIVKFIRSSLGVIAVIAVGVLAVLAFDARERQEVQHIKSNLHIVCQQVNAAGAELDRLSKDVERNRDLLTKSDTERGEDDEEADSSTEQTPSVSLNCEDLRSR